MADTANEIAERYIETNLVPPARQQNMGFSLFNKVTTLPKGKMSFLYEKITDVGGPLTTYGFPAEIVRDMITLTPTTRVLPMTVKGVKMTSEQINSFASDGIDIPEAAIQSILQVMGERRDDIVFTGFSMNGSTYDVEGMANLTSVNTESTSSVSSTAGNTIIKANLMLDKVWEDNINGVNFNLGLARGNYLELSQAIISGSGLREMPQVLDIINPYPGMPKGRIYWSQDITSNYAILSPVDPQGKYMKLVSAIDMDIVVDTFGPLKQYNPTYVTAIDAFFPQFYDVNCICYASGL